MSLLVSTPVHLHDGSDLFTATRHFTARPGWITPRAAFQALLTGDATLVDIRPAAERTSGVVPSHLGTTTGDLDQLQPPDNRTAVIVLADDDERAALATAVLRGHGVAASALAGGLPAWRAAGMPVTNWT